MTKGFSFELSQDPRDRSCEASKLINHSIGVE
jgi:hypothetical protein